MLSSGIDFKIKTIELEGKKIKLQIWYECKSIASGVAFSSLFLPLSADSFSVPAYFYSQLFPHVCLHLCGYQTALLANCSVPVVVLGMCSQVVCEQCWCEEQYSHRGTV